MGQVRVYIASSLDGFIAGPGDDIAWLERPRPSWAPMAGGPWAEVAVDALQRERGQLARQLASHHAALRRLAIVASRAPDAVGAISDLHERIAVTEERIVEVDAELQRNEAERLTPEEVDAAFADFDGLWKTLSPREQARSLGLVIQRVEFDANDCSISLDFHPEAIRLLGQERLKEAV